MSRYYRLQRHVKLGRERRERLMKVPKPPHYNQFAVFFSQGLQERTKQARNVIVAARPHWLQGYTFLPICTVFFHQFNGAKRYTPLDPQPALARFHGMCVRHPVFANEWRGGRLVMCAR